jgi:hypothetical protein
MLFTVISENIGLLVYLPFRLFGSSAQLKLYRVEETLEVEVYRSYDMK